MCFSAQAEGDYREYVRRFGADIDLAEFVRLYADRDRAGGIKTTKAMDAAFSSASGAREGEIKALIDAYDRQQAGRLEQELFKQSRRLADAQRTLRTRTTKKAQEDQRIAGNKIRWIKEKLADIRRSEPRPGDSRIFPGVYCPVMVMEGGRRVVRPMRYQCRPAGKPASYDRRYPGTYNARRDNLEGFWKDLFGHRHAIMLVTSFYENVSRHAAEGRALAPGEQEQNVVLEFRPEPRQDMLVACLWSRWTHGGEPDLLSFAAITDEPPAEVAAAGHDRCIIPIRPEHLDAWLDPDPADLAAQYAILDDRARPYYQHRMAA